MATPNSTNTVTNYNFLSPVGFKFTLARAPNLNYNVQRANLPGIQMSQSKVPNPLLPIPITGKISYNSFSVEFKVDEDLNNYLEIHNWMTALGSDDNFVGYQTLKNNERTFNSKNGLTSDINLSIMTSAMRPNISVDFRDCFPVDLTDLDMRVTDTALEYVDARVTFAYLRYDITRF